MKNWLLLLNFIILQWFFFRLAKVIDKETGKTIKFTWLGPVIPLTGWWSRYIWLNEWFPV